jgi:putative SOS response-associated peptidase YedK
MVMVDGCDQMGAVHDRMPTILRPDQWAQWTDDMPDEAFALCRTYPDLLVVERTDKRWASGRTG